MATERIRIKMDEPLGELLSVSGSAELCYSSSELFQSRQEIVIEHAGQHYRLRITRQDKLILTK